MPEPEPSRKPRPIVGEAARFVMVGLVNTAITWLVYLLLNRFMAYPLAYTLGFAVGMVVSFYLNCWFTWRVQPTLRRLLLFPSAPLVN